jgi:hypothetical protein
LCPILITYYIQVKFAIRAKSFSASTLSEPENDDEDDEDTEVELVTEDAAGLRARGKRKRAGDKGTKTDAVTKKRKSVEVKPSDSFKRTKSKHVQLQSSSEDDSSGSDSDQPVIVMKKKSKDAVTNALIQQLLNRQKQETQTLDQEKLNSLVTNAKAIDAIKTKEEQEKLALVLKFDQQINEKNSEAAAANKKRKLDKQKMKELQAQLLRQEKDLIVISRDLKHQQTMDAAIQTERTKLQVALQAERTMKEAALQQERSILLNHVNQEANFNRQKEIFNLINTAPSTSQHLHQVQTYFQKNHACI